MVSLVIPIHNRRELLPRLFDTLRRMEGCKVEIIFVDNNSDADTRATIQTFVDETNDAAGDIKATLLQENKPGSAAARNTGLDAATGDYVYFFDSDDELTPSMPAAAEALARKENADAVVLQINYVWPDGHAKPRNMAHTTSPRHHIIGNNFATQSLFLRRTFAIEHARWDETLFYWNDFEWALRILLARPKVAWLPGTWHKVYRHADSITGKRFADATPKIMAAHKAIEGYAKDTTLRRALNSRKALYAGHIRHEGDKQSSHLIYNSIDCGIRTPLDRVMLPLLYRLSAWGVRGAWRLAL